MHGFYTRELFDPKQFLIPDKNCCTESEITHLHTLKLSNEYILCRALSLLVVYRAMQNQHLHQSK